MEFHTQVLWIVALSALKSPKASWNHLLTIALEDPTGLLHALGAANPLVKLSNANPLMYLETHSGRNFGLKKKICLFNNRAENLPAGGFARLSVSNHSLSVLVSRIVTFTES